jgi:hypothetical protein
MLSAMAGGGEDPLPDQSNPGENPLDAPFAEYFFDWLGGKAPTGLESRMGELNNGNPAWQSTGRLGWGDFSDTITRALFGNMMDKYNAYQTDLYNQTHPTAGSTTEYDPILTPEETTFYGNLSQEDLKAYNLYALSHMVTPAAFAPMARGLETAYDYWGDANSAYGALNWLQLMRGFGQPGYEWDNRYPWSRELDTSGKPKAWNPSPTNSGTGGLGTSMSPTMASNNPYAATTTNAESVGPVNPAFSASPWANVETAMAMPMWMQNVPPTWNLPIPFYQDQTKSNLPRGNVNWATGSRR